ncbi:MAG: DsbA family oxidoreductase [Rubrobacter sp.]
MLIDVFSDVVCPWCYIGEKRLKKVLRERPYLEATVRWRPFQLQPGMPEGGLPWAEFARRKFGGEAGARAAFAQVAVAGEPDGVCFDFDRVASAPNTVNAHRLILYAAQRDLQWETAEALFRAYFVEGRDLNDRGQLVDLASGVGLDAGEVGEYLVSEDGTDEVQAGQQEAERLGITGVPFYVFDKRYALSGAQPVEVFGRALETAWAEWVT